jgi:hypothetical protein
MDVSVGTFNLNNLFSRFNFRADVETTTPANPGIAGISGMATGTTAAATEEPMASYAFGDGSLFVTRTYMGRLVRGKPERDTEQIANRIRQANLDVLAVQEVEDVVTLRGFGQEWLNGLYPYSVLVEGNAPRLIDLAVLSKLPIGGITSWQWAVHPDDPSEPVFSRDLLKVEIWNPGRSRRLLTLYNKNLSLLAS